MKDGLECKARESSVSIFWDAKALHNFSYDI